MSAALFDPRKVPLSVQDSWLCVSWLGEHDSFWIRTVSGGDEHTDQGRLLRLDLTPDLRDAARIAPEGMSFGDSASGRLDIAFFDADTIVIRGETVPVKLQTPGRKYDYLQANGNIARLCIARQDFQCLIVVRHGTLMCRTQWDGLSAGASEITVQPASGTAEVALTFARVEPAARPDADLANARRRCAQAFDSWRSAWSTSVGGEAVATLAQYILWSNRVPAGGALSGPAVYMSKNGMTNVWSWDHCFVALALALHDPAEALAQMRVIFDNQHETGRLPDFINDRFAYWSFTKPPIQGWTFSKLRRLAPQLFTPDLCGTVVAWLERQAASWMSGPILDGLPAYRHGNDAGWDNATIFLDGGPVASPDLATFLILQYDEIAALHDALGQHGEARRARAASDALLGALLAALWDGGRFISRLQMTGAPCEGGDSLIAFMPLLLGPKLPADHRAALLSNLKAPGRFLTPHGLATEALTSPHYRSNGYWRGPIWAPVTALLVDALNACGEHGFAADVRNRFCTMCESSGMAENFDAVTGKGLCDPAFAWTSAVYLSFRQALAEAAA